jgi:hypothetical protein
VCWLSNRLPIPVLGTWLSNGRGRAGELLVGDRAEEAH